MKKKNLNKAKLILAMSAIVFFLVSASAFCLFSVYVLINKAPFLDIEKLPRYSGTYILVIISLLIGVILSGIFRNYVLVPLHKSYVALEKISEGNFDVTVDEKGIRTVRRIAESVNITAKELGNVESLRNDFINNFSHEFKTPIVSISGFAKMLRHSELTEEERKEYLDIIINESERLSQLSSNVLTMTKLTNQAIVTGISRFNVTEQLRRTIILLEHKWTEKNISISFDSPEYLISANEDMLSQIWINLLDNAIKFSPMNSTVSVDITKNASSLIFTVSDSGKGMSEDDAKHAFDRFFQGDLSHKTGGYGIGLAITKRICELHNGSIRIKKTDESGTVFEIILPTER